MSTPTSPLKQDNAPTMVADEAPTLLTRRRTVRQRMPAIINSSRHNWKIYEAFIAEEYDECERFIKLQLSESKGNLHYPKYIKALILRRKGKINESLLEFQALLNMDNDNVEYALQVARSMYLLGRHNAACDIYNTIIETEQKNVNALTGLAQTCLAMGDYTGGLKTIDKSLEISYSTHAQITKARLLMKLREYEDAQIAFEKAIETDCDDIDTLIEYGVLLLQLGKQEKAFDNFGKALVLDPFSNESIVAAGSILQDRKDYDSALMRYRVSASNSPNAFEVWNNIGMCFFAKKKFVAAISCLKQAAYMAPLEWMIAYNLGLVHIKVQQFTSAFQFLTTAINLRPSFAGTYALLGHALTELKDFKNARTAFKRCLEIDSNDRLHLLNYTALLLQMGLNQEAKSYFSIYQEHNQQDTDASKTAIQSLENGIQKALGPQGKDDDDVDVGDEVEL